MAHTGSVLADQLDLEHVFPIDREFRAYGFTLVPEDVGSTVA